MDPYRTSAPKPYPLHECRVCRNDKHTDYIQQLKHPSGAGYVYVCKDCIEANKQTVAQWLCGCKQVLKFARPLSDGRIELVWE